MRITADAARALLAAGNAVALDCRFDLADPGAGARGFIEGHLPQSIHADLDRHLSDLTISGHGRHPLPTAKAFHRWLGEVGLRTDQTIIVYDGGIGMMAARAWWLLRHVGHPDVRLLDGGLDAWGDADLEAGAVAALGPATTVPWAWGRMPTLGTPDLATALRTGEILLVDARAAPRFEGAEEPLDRVAGHVPGAVNHPLTANVSGGRFLERGALAASWQDRLGATDPARVVHMCGSGVTACFNLFAMEHAGLTGSALYWPSWSGWIEDEMRPVAVGPA
ncbi:MAG: sulfurtransferase [Pseudomonadota bacterium]